MLDALFRIKDSIIALDNELTITYVNQAFADAVGLKVKEMLGKKIAILLPKSEPFMHNKIMESTKTKKVLNFEWTGPYANVFLETTIFPSANGVTIISWDITERKKAEQALKENQELFKIAFHNSPAALIITNLEDNRIRDVNQSLLSLLEYGREEIISYTTKELGIFPNYASREQLVGLMLEKGTIQNREVKLKTKNGKKLECVI